MTEQQQDSKKADGLKKRNILIAMDGSKHSEYAFEWFVKHIYTKETDTVILVQCAEIAMKLPTAAVMGSPATKHAMFQEHEKHVNTKFKSIVDLAKKHNIVHKLECLNKPGKPGEAIIKAADQQDVHLIIVGSRGQGTIRRTIMGSVSDYIMHHSHVPVIVCKHEDEHHKMK